MSEVNSEEENDIQSPPKLTSESPIKKGDFMTISQLQRKMNNTSGIPDEETISYNTSAIQNSQLTYSISQIGKSNLGKIEEVNENSQFNSLLFSQLQEQSQIQCIQCGVIAQQNKELKEQLENIKKQMVEKDVCYKVEIDGLKETLEQKDIQIQRLKQFELYAEEQQRIIEKKEQQIQKMKEIYEIRTNNLQQVVGDQTESIKQLHKQVAQSQNSSQIIQSPQTVEKIRLKQTQLKQQFDELSKLYDEMFDTPQTPTSSKKQILSRAPSRSIQLSLSEPKPTLF